MSFGEFIKTPNTVGMWHLNGLSVDSSGNGLNGTDTSIIYGKQYGKFNEGALFNGSNSVISLGSSSLLNLYSFSHTSIIWINITQYPTTGKYYYLFARGIYIQNSTQIYCRIRPDGKLGYGIASNRDAQYDYLETNTSILKNKWVCLIITRDMTNRIIKCYMNGSELPSTLYVTADQVQVYTPGHTFYLGADDVVASKSLFQGYMDEIKFENRIWTPQEVQKYYTNALGRF